MSNCTLTTTGTLYASHGSLLFVLHTFIEETTFADVYPMSAALVLQYNLLPSVNQSCQAKGANVILMATF
ncbi:MAG: hypothetical protein NVSMB49_13570 [Ktedonobacteraceae bacterium]